VLRRAARAVVLRPARPAWPAGDAGFCGGGVWQSHRADGRLRGLGLCVMHGARSELQEVMTDMVADVLLPVSWCFGLFLHLDWFTI